MELHLGDPGYHLRDIAVKAKTYSGGCVHGQHTLRFVESKEARLTDFVLVEKLCVRFILDGGVYSVQLIKKNYDVSLRIDKTQKDPISVKKMGVSE